MNKTICQKCNFEGDKDEFIEYKIKSDTIFLCLICNKHIPDSEKEFQKYIQEKIDSKLLDTFRKSNNSISKLTKKGMIKKFAKGKHLSKPPKGYKIENKKLAPNQEAEQVQRIFQEFLKTSISLTQLSKKNSMTTTGIKKLLKNKTYLGFVKFANQESQGNHQPIIDKQLFKQVQEKMQILGIK